MIVACLQLFSVVAFNGIDRDGSYTDGAGIFPTKYFHVYLEHWACSLYYLAQHFRIV